MAARNKEVPPDPARVKIMGQLPVLVDRLFELAEGVRVLDDDSGVIYRRPPERAAIEYLLNRVLGRPGQEKHEPDTIALSGSVTVILPDNGRDSGRHLNYGQRGGSDGDSSAAGSSDAVSIDAR